MYIDTSFKNSSNNSSLSWMRTVDFDKEKHLFSDKIKTNYKIDAYGCNCGHTEIIIYDQSQIIEYLCAECENKFFYDANIQWNILENLLGDKYTIINICKNIEYIDNKVVAKQAFMILDTVNLSSNKLKYKQVVLYEVSIDNHGDIYRNYSSMASEFMSHIEYEMIKYIEYNKIFNIPKNSLIFSTLDKIAFSIKNKNLLSNKYLFNRKEKSIIRTICQQYNTLEINDRKIYVFYIDVVYNEPQKSNHLIQLSYSKC